MLTPPQLNRLEQYQICHSGRSWWQVRYASGKIISEWATLQWTKIFSPFGPASTSRWEEIPKQGMRGLYLLCPNGKAAALEGDGDYTFFQLKCGYLDLGAGLGKGAIVSPSRRVMAAHIIGKVDGDDGHCVCYAWETANQRLLRFTDNVTHMSYQNIGTLSLGHHTGIK
jgi:hypothetical protein